MKRKAFTVVAYLAAVLAGAAPMFIALELTNRSSLQQAMDEAGNLAAQVLRRNEQITGQVFDAIGELEAAAQGDPCSAASVRLMLNTAMRHSRLQAVGFVQDDRLRCSSLGVHEGGGIALGAPDIVSSNGLAVRVQRQLPFDAQSVYRISSSLKSGFTVIVHTDSAFDAMDAQLHAGLGVIATTNLRPISQLGAWQEGWAKRLGAAPAAAFLEGDYVVALRRSGRYNYFSYVALPAQRLQDAWRQQARLLVPLGLLAGLLTGGLVYALARQQMGLTAHLRAALRRDGQLHLAYQPIVDLATGRWAGVEALLRWKQADGESVSPDIFIPLAERQGLIGQVTAKVIALVRRDMRTLLRAHPGFFMSINVASSDLHGEQLGAELTRTALALGVDAAVIRIEATERTFIDLGSARQGLARLRERGHPVAIDDFGTGYSSLSYLATLDVDCLKIDRSFVSTIGTGAATSEVVPHIIAMAQSLKLRMVAEGVETAEQADYLRERGVQFAQGWLFSRPLTLEALEQGLREQRTRQAAA